MKKYLKEEEYNQIVKIGRLQSAKQYRELEERLYSMGIDALLKGDELYISVEQDRNDPHYIDDVVDLAKKEYNNVVGVNISSFKLAENEIKWVFVECINLLLNENVVNDALFAIVKAQAKKMARKKIMQIVMCKREGDKYQPRNNFDKCILNVCDIKRYINEKDIARVINYAIDCVMDEECRLPDLSEYDMFMKINNGIEKFIKL